MAKPRTDPGTGSSYDRKTRRVINKDGSFNVKRQKSKNAVKSGFQRLINMKRRRFFAWVIFWYVGVNLLFALAYFAMGPGQIGGLQADQPFFLQSFYFSMQTFTTLGYGHLAPIGELASIVSSFEAMTGLLAFALFTGVMYGRFSRPTSSLIFSDNAIIAPTNDGKRSLQFKVANARDTVLMETEATVILLHSSTENGKVFRHYYELNLEMEKIMFFALTWTVVHVIDENSPLFDFGPDDFESKEVELMILMKGHDETFSQKVYSRQSYTADEIQWGAKFKRSFQASESGEIELNIDTLNDWEEVDVSI